MNTDDGAGRLLLVTTFTVVLLAVYAWVGTKLWPWFVTPVFHVASPSLPNMVGLLLLCRLVQGPTSPSDEARDPLHAFLLSLAFALIALGFGAVCATLMEMAK